MHEYDFYALAVVILKDIYKAEYENVMSAAAQDMGLDLENEEEEIVLHLLSEVYEAESEQLRRFAARLLPLIQIGESPLTGKIYKGFAKDGLWLAKVEV